MRDPVSVTRDGHRTFLKWHRARRRTNDPVFTGARIVEGMQLGASVEVDLVVHGGNGFAVLHDHADIARETTGRGPARAYNAAQLRALNLRGNGGEPIGDKVMLLEDLCALLAKAPLRSDALLQLDYKEKQGPLSAGTIAAFARSVGPVAGNMILSSGEADAVRLLSKATPGLRVGHDPCHGDAVRQLAETRDFTGFVSGALADSPEAEMIYLAYPVVLGAADAGFDLIGAFQAQRCRIDAYTLKDSGPPSVAIAERLLALKVDQITTDDPEGLAAALSP